MKTIDAQCLVTALNRAIKFQQKQPMSGVDVLIALTEVRDAVRYAIKPTNPKARRRKST